MQWFRSMPVSATAAVWPRPFKPWSQSQSGLSAAAEAEENDAQVLSLPESDHL